MKSAVIVLGLVANAAAAAVGENLPPLPLGDLGWSGSVTPGGPVLEYWGQDFADIEAKIRKDYPDFSIYSETEVSTPVSESSADPAVAARGVLEARHGPRHCQTRFGEVNPFSVNSCISNLRRISGGCKARARTCIRTQCVSGAAVGICNDNHHEINIPCPDIANMAENIKNWCYTHDTYCPPRGSCRDVNPRTSGQIFSNHSTWNVIVGACGFFGNGERPVKA
ncbi:hypothetical protein B0T11DRAFT_293122 [Plectosphaerella cucumerina]|uniref:Uncharacterized protein n=1 Tax=Plectosphaerella cucumerina TaxID=40658 RepID=A0A8K0X8J5_9PEZI|nr:hypothetical protein B0T11DRAFT_293122 [Plectosphaerella cucumerina]